MLLRLATHAMGTRFELVLGRSVARGGSDPTSEANLRAAGEEALFEIEQADRRLSLFRKDSLLSHINRSGSVRGVRVDPDTWELLGVCDAVWRASAGAFDPTVAPLMGARGFHDPVQGEPPFPGEHLQPHLHQGEALARVGWSRVRLDPVHRAIHLEDEDVALDLGAIGKGHGLDLAARSLREAGVTRALLHGGTSTVVAIGAPPGESAWRVSLGVGAPRANLTGASLSVSAPHGRTVEEGGESHGHVLDPRTGASADGLKRTAVIAPSATLADAWSTALLAGAGRPALPPQADLETLVETRDGEWLHTPSSTPGSTPGFSLTVSPQGSPEASEIA